MQGVAALLVMLSGCSLIATRGRRDTERGDTNRSCASYVHPVLDTVASAFTSAIGGIVGVVNADLHRGDHQGLGLQGYGVAGLFLAVGVTTAVSARVGYTRT